MKKFTVIVGMYNQLATLPALIASLEKQSFKDFEVIFCDDGSTDGTREFFAQDNLDRAEPLLMDWRYKRQENKGMRLAKNLNQGVKAARGQYCLFVMADSMLETDYLEVLNEYVEENRIVCGIRIQLAEVGGKMQGVDMDWRVKKNVVPQFPTVVISMPWLCLTGNGLTVPTSALRMFGGMWEKLEGYGGEDNELVARLYFKGYLCWSVPDLRLYHHWHKSSESNELNSGLVLDKIAEYER